MKRRNLVLVLVTLSALAGAVALSGTRKPRLLVLEWASRANGDRPPVAVLIELGLKDRQPTAWAGRARVKGARVVQREGYRFRPADRLTGDDGWEASSHRPLRLPARNPVLARLEGINTVGVVLHLADVTPDATLIVEPQAEGKEKAEVALKDVLAGKPADLWGGAGQARLVTTTMLLDEGQTENDFPAAAYGPDGTLWVASIRYRLVDEGRRVESEKYLKQPENFKKLYAPGFRDQLVVRSRRDGKWSEPLAVTGPNEDLVRCAVAADRDGTVYVAYSAHRGNAFRVFVRTLTTKDGAPRLGPERPVHADATPGARELSPVLCTAQDGRVHLACQALLPWKPGAETGRGFGTARWVLGEKGGEKARLLSGQGNRWTHALAAGPEGDPVAAYDQFRHGDYDILLDGLKTGKGHVATSPRFEARPAVCYDPQGRLWVAFEEGPEKWGQDYGALAVAGDPLYTARSVRVVCLDGGKLYRPVAELPVSKVEAPKYPYGPQAGPRFERGRRYSGPQLGLDGKGRLWLTYSVKYGSRYSTHPGSYWLTYARRLEGDHWSEPIEVHHSDGLLDQRPVLLPHPQGGLRIVHNGDDRYTMPAKLQNRIYESYVDLPGEPGAAKLVPHEAGTKDEREFAAQDEAVRRIRAYRFEVDGKRYQPLRGDFHRHTAISWDGGPDGSLEDMFRYALDAAGMDWIGNGDHDNGAGREYTWWLVQKLSDAYVIGDRFTPMFTYERSVAYPHGHRNCVFAQRGVLTLPRLAQVDPAKRVAGVHADDTKMLYRYLHELGGMCASHTSATSMGTDWRDNDPEVEPIVEIYQGDRMSYEKQGAPRAGYDPKSGKAPANIAGWFPKGYIVNALAKGYRLGFESSSDHWSTHISYCIPLAERHDRASILAALKQRHCYGATDNLVLAVRSGNHLMGDIFKTDAAPTLEVHAIGTGPLDRVEVLKDSNVVETFRADGREYRGRWTDPKPDSGTHYYYVRVLQKDGQLAWASPMWIEYTR